MGGSGFGGVEDDRCAPRASAIAAGLVQILGLGFEAGR